MSTDQSRPSPLAQEGERTTSSAGPWCSGQMKAAGQEGARKDDNGLDALAPSPAPAAPAESPAQAEAEGTHIAIPIPGAGYVRVIRNPATLRAVDPPLSSDEAHLLAFHNALLSEQAARRKGDEDAEAMLNSYVDENQRLFDRAEAAESRLAILTGELALAKQHATEQFTARCKEHDARVEAERRLEEARALMLDALDAMVQADCATITVVPKLRAILARPPVDAERGESK